ncbi:hypothetical protein N7G274_000297 [Stereocaulon virgatum]|uniref:Uncharacterized protein n=1 Tax=Stereocaulon virgatum TaxID=373712 RepID=A0ABR4AS47_9LECA
MPAPAPTPLLIPLSPPTPLPTALRLAIKSHLMHANAVPTILEKMNAECAKEGWEEKVRERVKQLVRRGEVRDKGELVRRIVREGRGVVDDEDEDEEEEGNGKRRMGEEGGEKEEVVVVVDIRVPEKAVREGGKVVRGGLDRVGELEPQGRDWWDT